MTEVEVKEQRYRIRRMPVIAAYHFWRRLAPVLTGAASMPPAAGLGAENLGEATAAMIRGMQPVVDAISRMSDAESEYVIYAALRHIDRQQGSVWSPVLAPTSNQLMFEDIELPQMMELVWRVIEENLRRFFPSSGQTSSIIRFPAA